MIPVTFTSENSRKRVQFFSNLPMASVYVYTQTHERRQMSLKKVQETLISFRFTTENFQDKGPIFFKLTYGFHLRLH